MPWICKEGGNSYHMDELSDDDWKRLDRILHAHGADILQEDDTGARIAALSNRDTLLALSSDLKKWGFDWVKSPL